MRGAFSLEKHQESGSQRENTDGKHRQKTHRKKTQTENTDRKHRQKTHREKTQTKNTDRKHTQKTQRENAVRKHREKTHRQKTQRENADRSTTQYYKVLHYTIPYYTAPHATTLYYKVLRSTPRQSRESSPGPLASKANALSARQIFWDDHIQTIVIANTMRRAIVQIQNTNVHTPRPMRGAIPRAQNLRFATVSRDRPTESYERVHPAKSKCAFRYSGVPSKMSKCTFRYSGVHGNV